MYLITSSLIFSKVNNATHPIMHIHTCMYMDKNINNKNFRRQEDIANDHIQPSIHKLAKYSQVAIAIAMERQSCKSNYFFFYIWIEKGLV